MVFLDSSCQSSRCAIYKKDVITHMVWVFLSFLKFSTSSSSGEAMKIIPLNLQSLVIPMDWVRGALEDGGELSLKDHWT